MPFQSPASGSCCRSTYFPTCAFFVIHYRKETFCFSCCLNALTRTSSTDRSVESGHPCLVPDPRGKGPDPVTYDVSSGLFVNVLSQIEEVSFYF